MSKVTISDLNLGKIHLKKTRKYIILKLDYMENKTILCEFQHNDPSFILPPKEKDFRYEIQRVRYKNIRDENNNHVREVKQPKLNFR